MFKLLLVSLLFAVVHSTITINRGGTMMNEMERERLRDEFGYRGEQINKELFNPKTYNPSKWTFRTTQTGREGVFGRRKHTSRVAHNYFCNYVLNKQIKREFDVANTYLSLSNHFAHDTKALYGFSKIFEHQWKSSLRRGELLMRYVTIRGGSVCTPTISKPVNDTNWSKLSVCKVLETLIDLEKFVKDGLLDIHTCARGDNKDLVDSKFCNKQGECEFECVSKEVHRGMEDPQLQNFVEEEFLKDQVVTIKLLSDLLRKVERATVGFPDCSGIGVEMMDKVLKKKLGIDRGFLKGFGLDKYIREGKPEKVFTVFE